MMQKPVTMTKSEFREYREAVKERDAAERDYTRMTLRRSELEGKSVRNEDLKARCILRLDREISDAYERMLHAQLALEHWEAEVQPK